MITEIEIKDNLDWFIDNNFEVKITNSPLHPFPSSNKSSAMMDNVKKINIYCKKFMEYIQSKELFKIKENIYKNLYRFYKLNSDCKITFEIVKYIKYKDYYSSDSKILEKFNLTTQKLFTKLSNFFINYILNGFFLLNFFHYFCKLKQSPLL